MKTASRAKAFTVGVVVGRFQTPYLHEGHQYLLNRAQASNRKLLIAVGVSGGAPSMNDPLNFETRAEMLRAKYPDAVIVPIRDHESDQVWSKNLDQVIVENFPNDKVLLFGSRDSFLSYYLGKYPYQKVRSKPKLSATLIRKQRSSTILDSDEFRSGVIYAASKQNFPTSFQTIDIVVRHSVEDKILVGRKAGESGWRFPGGFVDPTDQTLENAVKREAREELGDIEIDGLKYVASLRVDDHRYRKSEHKIMTALFEGTFIYGGIKAGDDLEEVRWQPLDGLLACLVEVHKPLGALYLEHLEKQKGKI